ncbi:hypothetical protein C7974DRAFT_398450 [Boeremia exigua]|uniref:uncharacterized protein n=1 Tax=Boeremia exigua TaxID=749465 RepID=UPI001E8DD4E1|nr:uncharacterized protein C7974DRAFT_398450 [Boeremia exigua]KAH6619912.1 hypothetical protein C7974DRAFT_398450 [Boeremia exigua]
MFLCAALVRLPCALLLGSSRRALFCTSVSTSSTPSQLYTCSQPHCPMTSSWMCTCKSRGTHQETRSCAHLGRMYSIEYMLQLVACAH